jgi:dolichol-phosphate mannosyltransferase
VYVLLPTYNEGSRIQDLLQRIDDSMAEATLPYHVILMDDGSIDSTEEIVRRCSTWMPITYLRHEINLGLGVAIRDGLIAAIELAGDRDVIVTMDADNTHAPGLILRMKRMISEGHDVVIASRYQPGARVVGVPLLRRFLSYSASIIMRILFPGLGVRDFTCGYRAYRAEVIQSAIRQYGKDFLDQDGFQCMVDILLKLRKMNLIFGEVPMILRYDLKEGKSKMKLFQTVWKTLLLILKRRLGK